MPTTSRRKRTPDPLASTAAVREVLRELAERLPRIPSDERALVSFLRAAVYAERPRTASRRGRPSKWPARDLALAASILREILGRGTYGRKDVRSFVEHYLRLLAFPADVLEALERGEINLFEAEQLARLTPRSLGVPPAKASASRSRVLRAHLAARESGARLRARVEALLARPEPDSEATRSVSPEILEAAAEIESELADSAALKPDPTAVFYDLLSTVAFTLQEVDPSEISEQEQERLFEYCDRILMILGKVRRDRDRRLADSPAARSGPDRSR